MWVSFKLLIQVLSSRFGYLTCGHVARSDARAAEPYRVPKMGQVRDIDEDI